MAIEIFFFFFRFTASWRQEICNYCVMFGREGGSKGSEYGNATETVKTIEATGRWLPGK